MAAGARARHRRAGDGRRRPAPARVRPRRARPRQTCDRRAGARLDRDPPADDDPGRRCYDRGGADGPDRDIGRFPTPRDLVGYLGLDPRLRQSGVAKPRQWRISKEGSAAARHALVESAWVAARAPGPLRAFAERTAARRGRHIAAVAVARKLACSPGTSSVAARTTLTSAPPSSDASCAGSSSRPARRARSAAPKPHRSGAAAPKTTSSASSPAKPSSPTSGSSPTGSALNPRAVRVRHRGAHLLGRQSGKQRGRRQPHLLRFSSSSPAPTRSLPRTQPIVHRTFIHTGRKSRFVVIGSTAEAAGGEGCLQPPFGLGSVASASAVVRKR